MKAIIFIISIYLLTIGAIVKSADFTVVKANLYGKLRRSVPDYDHIYACLNREFIQKTVDFCKSVDDYFYQDCCCRAACNTNLGKEFVYRETLLKIAKEVNPNVSFMDVDEEISYMHYLGTDSIKNYCCCYMEMIK